MPALDAPLNQPWKAWWQPRAVEGGNVKEGYVMQKNLAGNRILVDPESGDNKGSSCGSQPGGGQAK